MTEEISVFVLRVHINFRCTPVIGGIRCSPDRHQLPTTLAGVLDNELNAQNLHAVSAFLSLDGRFFLAPVSFAFAFLLSFREAQGGRVKGRAGSAHRVTACEAARFVFGRAPGAAAQPWADPARTERPPLFRDGWGFRPHDLLGINQLAGRERARMRLGVDCMVPPARCLRLLADTRRLAFPFWPGLYPAKKQCF
jgi:hypothetical protein